MHGLEAQQPIGLRTESCTTALTGVGTDRYGVVVAAVLAAPRIFCFDRCRAVDGARELHPNDFIAGTLVIDQRAGTELADRKEPRPLQVVPFPCAASGAATR